MSSQRRALMYCRTVGDVKAMCRRVEVKCDMLSNRDMCLSYIYCRFLCEAVSRDTVCDETHVWLAGVRGHPEWRCLQERTRRICEQVGSRVEFHVVEVSSLQALVARGGRHVVLLHRPLVKGGLLGDMSTLVDVRSWIDESAADYSLVMPITYRELEDCPTVLDGASVMLGIATGKRTSLFGVTLHRESAATRVSPALLHGLLNWYDVRVRTMRDERERCWDCRLFRLYCCDPPSTSESIRRELSRVE